MTTVFSYVSKEELSVIQLNSPFFLLILHRSDLIAKKKGVSWEDICRYVSFNYLWSSDHKQNEKFHNKKR